MVVDISEVVKVPGTEIKINKSGVIENLTDIYGSISVVGPVTFDGVIANMDGVLYLEGDARCTYVTSCDYCNSEIVRDLKVKINEDLVDEQKGSPEEDQYTFSGNVLYLDKILSDQIVLAMPLHHRCSNNCRIICEKCGKPITGEGCGCRDDNDGQPIDPRLAALKDLLEKKNTDEAE
ncbi:hypothetical protein CSTERLE_03540 [Thermoclostridium stercorarium subsp. leptospartum DSM 9219]|jgi:uncharacterized protein|uniref:DUF177 domain-containing protein n=1 Tax=Thermoclostridium stercorarium subsp. leptospartum DSM 9219 TaxID=1346611 RepID=A0A1B1YIZ8_THEST|nr:DUF177 domain-containing protein [Thermoclostridium stercorarium]ANX00724.1 hypothetical protein CSTERLE_03540 [Thermoclostridium stercorarium subsp. leptospartum DSM 9219]